MEGYYKELLRENINLLGPLFLNLYDINGKSTLINFVHAKLKSSLLFVFWSSVVSLARKYVLKM